jgi:curved DNA-binding protein CbpA
MSADWTPAGKSLTPAEGFLLSRIDGTTAWGDLRNIGGMPPEEVDRCLERWLEEGVVTLEGREIAQPADESAEPPAAISDGDGRIDPSLDIDPELQRNILEFEGSLDRGYFEILDVESDADAKEIKRAYFRLSKVFHPDRYFRRNLGDYRPRLDRIFRKLVEAYELLTDPMTRAEIERTMGSMLRRPAPDSAQSPPAPGEPSAPAGKQADSQVERRLPPRKLNRRETLERLRRHFRLPENIMAERRMKADEFFQSAMLAARRERWNEAAPSLRLAIAFDPWNDEYRTRFAEFQAMYHEQRARDLLEQNELQGDGAAQSEALRLIEEVLIYRPADAAVTFRAAALALELREFDRAIEYGEGACSLCPESAEYHLLLGRIQRTAGLREKAMETFKNAARLDPEDPAIKQEIRETRRSPRRNR